MKPPHQNNSTEKIPLDIKIEVTMNHVLLILGFVFNFLTIIVIVFNKSMHKSTNCYILSLVLSNLILLLDTLRDVLAWWYNIDIFLDTQFIMNLTFKASILTLAMLTIDRYIFICSRDSVYSSIYGIIPKLKTGAKSILVIWITTSMVTAMELHLYAQFELDEDYKHNVNPAIQIFVISTFIFLVTPTIFIFCLGSLMICELEQLRLLGGVSKKDVESLRLLAGLTIGFFMTMMPYRVALIFTYTIPNICCSKDNLKVYFIMVKGAIIVFPVICFATSKQFQTALKDTIFCYLCSFRKLKRLKKTTPISLDGED